MSIHELHQRLRDLYRMDDIDRLHDIAEYLRNNLYMFEYQDTSIIVYMKAVQSWDIVKFNHLIESFNVCITMIPASDNTFKIFIEKKL